MNNIKMMLSKLGYDVLWLNSSFLNQQELLKQFEELHNSEDKNPEHYRYKVFKSILSKQKLLNDTQIEQYIKLAEIDPDPSVRKSALILMINFNNLSLEQLRYLSEHPTFNEPIFQKQIIKANLKKLLELQTSRIDSSLFQSILKVKNYELQYQILSSMILTENQLLELVQDGANKAIRNIAKQKLNAARFRENE